MWCSAAIDATTSNDSGSNGWVSTSPCTYSTPAPPARLRAGSSVGPWRSMPVTEGTTVLSSSVSSPSPQPTSSAVRLPGGTAASTSGW
jgi:hypothetical protein